MDRLTLRLRYLSNFSKINLGEYIFENQKIIVDNLHEFVFSIVENNQGLIGVSFASPRILVDKENDLRELNGNDIDEAISSENTLDLVVSNVIAPEGAQLVARLSGGVDLIFHKNEKNHSPHIHAKYAEEKVSIGLTKPFKIKGKMKRQKLEIALEYVRENLDDLLSKWNSQLFIDKRYK